MEVREIVVVETKNQRKSVIMSSAVTLGELKVDLDKANIDYRDMSFHEGISKTELMDNSSTLPHDIPYKGTTTNKLVFMLTNTNKKIKSGAEMCRAEAYKMVKDLGLQSECIKQFGKNFTMCKTSDIVNLINEYAPKKSEDPSPIEDKTSKSNLIKEDIKYDPDLRDAFLKLATILEDNGAIEYEDRKEIQNFLYPTAPVKEDISSYSANEINEMFNFIK